MTKRLISYLANERALGPQAYCRHRDVGRRTARLGPKGLYLGQATAQLGGKHVNKQLTQAYNVHPVASQH
jgi:hypothetical protein